MGNGQARSCRWDFKNFQARRFENEFQTIEVDRMVGPHGKVVSPFRPTSRKRDGDRTTKLRRRNVDAEVTYRPFS